MKITIMKDKAFVFTPYNRDFVDRIHGIGGAKWNGRCWEVPADAVDLVKRIMVDVYGVSDLGGDTVDVEIRFLKTYYSESGENLIIAGKSIARGFGRDSNVVIDADTRIIEGSIKTGGSRKYWSVRAIEGTVIMVKNVSRAKLAEVEDEELEIKVLERSQADQVANVDAEIQRLKDAIKQLEERKSDLTKEDH